MGNLAVRHGRDQRHPLRTIFERDPAQPDFPTKDHPGIVRPVGVDPCLDKSFIAEHRVDHRHIVSAEIGAKPNAANFALDNCLLGISVEKSTVNADIAIAEDAENFWQNTLCDTGLGSRRGFFARGKSMIVMVCPFDIELTD